MREFLRKLCKVFEVEKTPKELAMGSEDERISKETTHNSEKTFQKRQPKV